MDSVFMVWHGYEVDGDTEQKLISVYKTHEDAKSAIGRVQCMPGFKDTPNGFEIFEHVLGRDGWTEPYISQVEGGSAF